MHFFALFKRGGLAVHVSNLQYLALKYWPNKHLRFIQNFRTSSEYISFSFHKKENQSLLL